MASHQFILQKRKQVYSMVTIVDNTVLYTGRLLRVNLKHCHTHIQIKGYLRSHHHVLIHLIVIIILQCILVSNNHILYLELTQSYILILSNAARKKWVSEKLNNFPKVTF